MERRQRPRYRRVPKGFAKVRPRRSDYAAAVRDGGTWLFAVGAAFAAIVLLAVVNAFFHVADSMFLFWAAMAMIGTMQGSAETHAREREISG
jgi:hypothetical protein